MAFAVSKVASQQSAVLRKRTSLRSKAARTVRVQAADRPLWFPGNDAPSYLDGTLAGDYGFDPLGLGSDPEYLRWYVQSELIHCRTAMTAVAGILFPAIATQAGAGDFPQWYEAGKVSIESSGIPLGSQIAVTLLLSAWAETKRWQDFENPGSQGDGSFFGITDDFKGKANGYPGGRYFDFMGFAEGDPAMYARYKQSEVVNGRLAMVALVGFVAQYKATGQGPIENLAAHLANPTGVTFATNGVSVPHLG